MTGVKFKKRVKQHYAAAFREAGHAVASWDRRIMLMPVSLSTKAKNSGGNVWNDALRNVDFDWVRAAESSELVERLAAVMLAGPVAQDIFYPGAPKGPIHTERLRQAKTLLASISNGGDDRRTRYENARRELEKFLTRSDVADAVAAVARALLQRDSVAGEKITALIEKRCRRPRL